VQACRLRAWPLKSSYDNQESFWTKVGRTVSTSKTACIRSDAVRHEARPSRVGRASPQTPRAQMVDFNRVYSDYIKPALEMAGLEPFRADQERRAGHIITDMFQLPARYDTRRGDRLPEKTAGGLGRQGTEVSRGRPHERKRRRYPGPNREADSAGPQNVRRRHGHPPTAHTIRRKPSASAICWRRSKSSTTRSRASSITLAR
jgi:hypothetical protein